MSENSTSGDSDLLEKLALSLLDSPGDAHGSHPRLFPGIIPDNFPIAIPLPEQSRVLGTLVRSETQIAIVLESDLSPEELFNFYHTQLTSLGWSEPEGMGPRAGGGFLYSDSGPYSYITFCQGIGGPGLTLNIVERENTPTNVRLNINLDRKTSPCAQETIHRRMHHHNLYAIIPPLAPPQGAQQHSKGGGSSGDEVHTTATLKTGLALDTLVKHYADQLSQAGWTQTDAGVSGPLAWHTWSFSSEEQQPWSSLFFILKTPDKSDDYFLYIRATWNPSEDDNQPFAGWISSSSTFTIG
jgi:hypothetical protein